MNATGGKVEFEVMLLDAEDFTVTPSLNLK